MNFEEMLEKTKVAAEELGMIKERNRILTLMVYYKEAGWLDEAFAHLMVEDICGAEDR